MENASVKMAGLVNVASVLVMFPSVAPKMG